MVRILQAVVYGALISFEVGTYKNIVNTEVKSVFVIGYARSPSGLGKGIGQIL